MSPFYLSLFYLFPCFHVSMFHLNEQSPRHRTSPLTILQPHIPRKLTSPLYMFPHFQLTDSLLLTRYSGSATASAGPLNLDYVLPLTGMRISVPVGANDEYQNEFSVVSTTRSFSLTAR